MHLKHDIGNTYLREYTQDEKKLIQVILIYVQKEQNGIVHVDITLQFLRTYVHCSKVPEHLYCQVIGS